MGRLRSLCVGWVGGSLRIMPRCGSILQAETYQIFSLAENPRWSRVWQNVLLSYQFWMVGWVVTYTLRLKPASFALLSSISKFCYDHVFGGNTLINQDQTKIMLLLKLLQFHRFKNPSSILEILCKQNRIQF